MDIDKKIGQHFICGFPGTELDEEFREAVRTYKISNVILFARNIESKEQVSKLCAEIQSLVRRECGTDAIIGIDQEGGMVTRLSEDCTNTPGAMALAATGKRFSAYQAGEITGSELNALGIMCNFAPVLDVNSNRENAVIGVRSFGDTAQKVSEYGVAMAEGLQSMGVMAVGKHFPGHGDTHIDSHIDLPIIEAGRESLAKHIEPFRAAIQAGIEGIMTTHILFPAFEKQNLPATMSRAILTDFLKGELGFKGVVFTDCMEMQAIGRYYGTVEGSLSALQAGADIVCISHHVQFACQAVALVRQALEDGRLDWDEFEASTQKILLAKAQLAKQKRQKRDIVGSPTHRKKVQALVEQSLCLVHDTSFSLGKHPLFVGPSLFHATTVSNPDQQLSFAPIMQRLLGGSSLVTSENPQKEEINRIAEQVSSYSSVVLATYNGHLFQGQLALVKRVATEGIPVCVIALRNPYDLAEVPTSVHQYAAFSYREDVCEACAKALSGLFTPTGKLPITV